MRVPDHGGLAPWRILLIEGAARARLGEFLVQRALDLDPGCNPARLAKDRDRFNFAPLILTVIAHLHEHSKVPVIEQILSAGTVCFTLLQAAQALGFGAQWLTGWAAYDAGVLQHLGLAENERIVGFVHLGTATQTAPERRRPDWREHVSTWPG